MTPQLTPIAEKALAHGKALEFSVDPIGFHSLCGRPSMFTLATLFGSQNSISKMMYRGSNTRGTPQPQLLLAYGQSFEITGPQSNSSFCGSTFRGHTSPCVAGSHTWDPQCPSVISDYVTGTRVASKFTAHSGTLPLLPESKALPLEWLLGPKTRITLHERVMARLIQAEAHETDIWLRQDYRQAFICVSLAAKGNTEPFVVASYQVYGIHPDKVWPKILWNRQARLAREYRDWYDASGMMKPDLPKKPSTYSNPAAEKFCKDRLPLPSPDKETA